MNPALTTPDTRRRPRVAQESPLLRRMRGLSRLSPREAALVAALGADAGQEALARSEIHAAGCRAAPVVILSGWACRQHVLPDGRRQIVSFLLPGDVAGTMPGLPAPCATVALTRLRTASAAALFDSQGDPAVPGLAQALGMAAMLDGLLLRDQVVRLGQQTAYERFGSLVLELHHRLSIAGLAASGRFAFPLTQEVLADALGLSLVHVNRTVQQMRRDRLVDLRAGSLTILDEPGLQAVADWRPAPLDGMMWEAGGRVS